MQWLYAAAIGVLPPQPAPLAGAPPAPAASRWWLENDGRPVGVPDADVDAAAAWAVTTGDPSILVAIVDSGVDVAHPQLAGAIRVNAGEIPGNALDDDGNGYADDVTGWDFADGDNDVFDPFAIRHGTPVAGLVAGTTTGLAPGVTLLPVKIFSDSGVDPLFELAAIEGIQYAIDEGARVIQISWTIAGTPGAGLDAVFAAAEAAGVVVVVAAGNDGEDLDAAPLWPASYPDVIAVAGTDRYDRFVDLPTLFRSAYGPSAVDLAAPTEKLVTTVPPGEYPGGEFPFTGTSAAAPLVSAAAALVLSVDPSLTAAEVRAILSASADPLPSLEGRVASGRLNAGNAVILAGGSAAASPHAEISAVHRAEPLVATLFDSRNSGGVLERRWLFSDRDDLRDAFATEHRFHDGGLWPVTLEVAGADGLTHTAHTETLVPFRGTAYPRSDASAHPYAPGLQQVTVSIPGALALRLHFTEIDLAPGDAIILYDSQQGGVRALTGSAVDHEELLRGDTAYLHLRASTGGAFGFALDRVDAVFEREANRAPTIAVTGASGAARGTPVEFAASTLDPDGDAVSISWRLVLRPEDSTAELSATAGETSALTPDARGEYAIAVTADDGVSEASTLTWVVTRAHDDPGFTCAVSPRGGSAASFVLLVLACCGLRLVRLRE